MIVYTGRKGIHIFDIDRERWVYNSRKSGYQYEDIYHEVRDIESESELGYDDEEFSLGSEDEAEDEDGSSQGVHDDPPMLDGPPQLEELKELMENEMQDDEEFSTPTGSKEDEFLNVPP